LRFPPITGPPALTSISLSTFDRRCGIEPETGNGH
jgi:hypothetical protein